MDRMGYDAFWMAKHHLQHAGYERIPNVLMDAVHLVHLTPRLRIGSGSTSRRCGIPSGIPAAHKPLEIDFVHL